jgi:hypothetical protein
LVCVLSCHQATTLAQCRFRSAGGSTAIHPGPLDGLSVIHPGPLDGRLAVSIHGENPKLDIRLQVLSLSKDGLTALFGLHVKEEDTRCLVLGGT